MNMFIRKSPIKSKKTGGSYFSYRLVESVRVGDKVQQKTLLNLGKHFDVEPALWRLLAQRIEQIVYGPDQQQGSLFDLKNEIDLELEKAAQRYAALALQKLSTPVLDSNSQDTLTEQNCDFQTVDLNRLAVLFPRSIGNETLSYYSFKQLQLDEKLISLGFNQRDLCAAIGNIIGRMIHPGSERETHRWLQNNSALGELIGHDYGGLSLDRLYQVGDKLLKHKNEIEHHLSLREQSLFNLKRTIVLYDLTNTYFEGQSQGNAKASRGRSKEKRSDCPLVTMGLVMDGDGFPLNSQIFPGNASEPQTLETMLTSLKNLSCNVSSTVVLDAGIATQGNLDWLKKNGYHYVVVSRERYKEKPSLKQGAVKVKDVENDQVIAKQVKDPETGEIRLYCHSQKREHKDAGIRDRFYGRYELSLKKLNEGLSKKGTVKRYEKILERLGRLKEQNARVAQDYTVTVKTDDDKIFATEISFKREKSANDKDKNAGVYCLRTNLKSLSEKELWQTYVMLVDLEASFRSMKSELGMRPVYHQKEKRVDAHLFITLLAYHLVHTLRTQFKAKGIHLSWQSIRNIMANQHRLTISMPTKDKQQIHVRSTTKPEAIHQKFYDALELSSDPLGVQKTVMS